MGFERVARSTHVFNCREIYVNFKLMPEVTDQAREIVLAWFRREWLALTVASCDGTSVFREWKSKPISINWKRVEGLDWLADDLQVSVDDLLGTPNP